MTLQEIFKNNKKIIINTDIDGILSGLLLCEYYSCEVVGFSNSSDKVWIDPNKIKSIKQAVSIDMFIVDPDVVCIEQHIIAVDDQHVISLSGNPNKLNPNLSRNRSFSRDYRLKYPFGTVHYLIALMEREGISINCDLQKSIDNQLFGQYLLRADDAMKSTLSAYRDNAIDWWHWLFNLSNKGRTIKNLTWFVNALEPSKANIYNSNIAIYLKSKFHCDGNDGGYSNILGQDSLLTKDFLSYISFLQKLSGWGSNCNLSGRRYYPLLGTAIRCKLSAEQIKELKDNAAINNICIFSYSFVYSSTSEKDSFSYTINLPESIPVPQELTKEESIVSKVPKTRVDSGNVPPIAEIPKIQVNPTPPFSTNVEIPSHKAAFIRKRREEEEKSILNKLKKYIKNLFK